MRWGRTWLGEEPEPNTCECTDCDRTFEKDGPPEQVICVVCGTREVQRIDEAVLPRIDPDDDMSVHDH